MCTPLSTTHRPNTNAGVYASCVECVDYVMQTNVPVDARGADHVRATPFAHTLCTTIADAVHIRRLCCRDSYSRVTVGTHVI
jgi:hypothetical protein